MITFVVFSFFLHCIIATVFTIKGSNRNNKAIVEGHSSNIERDFIIAFFWWVFKVFLIHLMFAVFFTIFFLIIIRDAVRDFLHEIYFLPDLPELKEVQVVLQEYRKVQLLLFICLALLHQINSWQLRKMWSVLLSGNTFICLHHKTGFVYHRHSLKHVLILV